MNYPEAETYLDQLQFFKIKLGLDTTRELLTELGGPHEQLNIIHLAGTNGKGSVGATALAILTAAGYRTGFYSSPHLSSVRERFRIGASYISKDDFSQLVSRLQTLVADRQAPTYFEFTTLLALCWFQQEKVDVVILETGMGGRLDATNVVTPLVAVITDISRDHEQYLGTSLAAIAGEKAGIIKPGVPVIFSGRAQETVPVIAQRCRELQSPLFLYDHHFFGSPRGDQTFDYAPITGMRRNALPLALAGEHQVVNASLALAALELIADRFPVPPQALVDGLQQVNWPGRLELLALQAPGKTLRVLLDGAHNEAGVIALRQALIQGYPRHRLFLIWGNMVDKQIRNGLLELMELADTVIFTQAESLRSAAPAAIQAQIPEPARAQTHCAETVEQALDMAATRAHPDDLICVAGSLYLVGRMRPLLRGDLAV